MTKKVNEDISTQATKAVSDQVEKLTLTACIDVTKIFISMQSGATKAGSKEREERTKKAAQLLHSRLLILALDVATCTLQEAVTVMKASVK